MRRDRGLAAVFVAGGALLAALAAPAGPEVVLLLAVLGVLAVRAGAAARMPRAARERLDLALAAGVAAALLVATQRARFILSL